MVGSGFGQAVPRFQRARALEAPRESCLSRWGRFGSSASWSRLGLSLGLLVLVPVTASVAQPPPRVEAEDSFRIKGVEVKTYDVYRPSEAKNFIFRAVNGLHITTRPSIVRRELLFKTGEVYDSAVTAETERNLRGLRVFRHVRVDSARTDSGLVMRVETQDALSTRIEGAIGVSGTQGRRSRKWWIGIQERNLFGTATQIGIRYRNEPDRTAVLTSFSRQRLFDNRIGVGALYDNRSDGSTVYGQLSLPFLSSTSRASWYLTGEERSERILRYVDGAPTARDTLQRRFWNTTAGHGWAIKATTDEFLRIAVLGQLRRDDYAIDRRVDTLGRSVSGTVGAYLHWRRTRFLVQQGFQGFGRQEDIDLSTSVQAGVNLTPKAFGYREDGIVPNVSFYTGVGWSNGFARFTGSGLARITDAGRIDSGSVHLSAILSLQPRPRQMAMFYVGHGWLKNPMPGAEFDLGLEIGPRGFQDHSFTGDRAFLVSGEYRYTLTDNFLRSAGLGLAGFAEYGGAWYHGSRRRTGDSIGVGLRVGLTISSDLDPVRIDFARIGGSDLERGRFEIAIGKGFTFNLGGRLTP
jgi:hypothetical protein